MVSLRLELIICIHQQSPLEGSLIKNLGILGINSFIFFLLFLTIDMSSFV